MNYTQWTTSDDTIFFPAGRAIKQLPSGYYSVDQTMNGICFVRKPTKTEQLIRFPDSNSDRILNEIENFWNLEKQFRESKIAYKRGLLAYGPPGSGKSCTIRLVIENLINRGGIVFDFPGCELLKGAYEIVRTVHPEMPIVILMEDLDQILGNYNQSSVLNLLDGIYGIDKVVFLATTNYPEKLGSRIMNRPSRFDKRIFIGMPNKEARTLYLKSKLTNESEIQKWAEDTEGLSIAHLKELYVANKILGDSYEEALKTLKEMKIADHSDRFDDYNNAKLVYSPEKIAEEVAEDINHNAGLT